MVAEESNSSGRQGQTPVKEKLLRSTLYRGMARPFDPKFKSYIITWWTPSRQRALLYAGRTEQSTLLFTSLKNHNWRLLDASDVSKLPLDAPIDFQSSDALFTGSNETIERYLRKKGYDGLIWKESDAITVGLLPEANKRLRIQARLWWQEAPRNELVQNGQRGASR